MKRRAFHDGCRFLRHMLALTCGLSFVWLPAHAQTGSAIKGQVIFETRCAACHSLDANRVGPALGGVLGRLAGKVADFGYSPALAAASYVWDRDKLLTWLENPQSLVPGQAMGYRVESLDDRLDVVAYLGTRSKNEAAQ